MAWNVTRWMSSRGIVPWGGYPEGVVHHVNETEIIAQDPTQQSFLLPWTLMPPGRMAVGVLYQRTGARADDRTLLTVTHGSNSVSHEVRSNALPGKGALLYAEDGVLLEHSMATGGPIQVAFPGGQLKGIIVRAPQQTAPSVFDQGGALFCHPTALQHSNGKTYWTDHEIYSGDVYLSDSSGKTVHVFTAPGSSWNDRLHTAAVLGELASGDLVVAATFHVNQRCYLRLLSPDLDVLSPVRNLGGAGLYTYLHLAVTADDRLHLLSRGSVDGTSSTTAVRLRVTGAQSIGQSPPSVERDQITGLREDWMYPIYWRVHRDPQTAEEFLIAGWRPVSGGKTARGLGGAIWHPASNRWFTWAGQSADHNEHNGTTSSPRFSPQTQRQLVTHGGLNTFIGPDDEQVWQIPQQPGLWATLDSHRPGAPTASIMTVVGHWTGSITALGAPSFLLHSYSPRDGVLNQKIWPDYRPLTALGGGSIVPVSDSAALMVLTERSPQRLHVDVMGEVPNGFYDLGGTQLGLYLLTRSKGRPICRRLTGTESLPGWVEPTLTMTHVDYAAGNRASLQFRVLAGVNELHPTHRGSRSLLLNLPGVKPPPAL